MMSQSEDVPTSPKKPRDKIPVADLLSFNRDDKIMDAVPDGPETDYDRESTVATASFSASPRVNAKKVVLKRVKAEVDVTIETMVNGVREEVKEASEEEVEAEDAPETRETTAVADDDDEDDDYNDNEKTRAATTADTTAPAATSKNASILPNGQPAWRELEVKALVGHRVDEASATVELQVQWEGGETSWETEWGLQSQVPQLVYKYWERLQSREDATGLDIYHVFRLLKRTLPPKGKRPRYFVQWVGYRSADGTWEPEEKISEIAPEELMRFEAKHGPPGGKRKGVARPVARPKKRTKRADD